jgi:hypothetical protein
MAFLGKAQACPLEPIDEKSLFGVKFAGPGGLAGDGCCGRMMRGDGEVFSLRVRSNQDRSLNEEFAIGSVRVVGKKPANERKRATS